MRRCCVLTLAAVVGVKAFLPAPGISSFTGRSISHTTKWTGRSGPIASWNRRDDAIMSVDGGKVLVSGFLNSKERTDQFVFDILQAQGKWEKIVAFSQSVSFAKKRLVSRKSRYSGLLDVLEFVEGDQYDANTMEEKLQGCSAWLCFDCEGHKVKESVEVAKKAGVQSMVISSSVSAADATSAGIEDALEASGLEYTFIRVGELVEGKEGGAVMVANMTDDLPVEQIVRDDIIRLSAEAFVMQNVTNEAFAFGKGDEQALEYLKGLRQNGTDRRTEMSTLISGGFRKYQEMKAAEEAERNKPPPTEEELAERDRLFYESREEEYAKIRQENARKREQDFKKKAEKEAHEFLEKEWNAQYWTRNTTLTMEEYQADEDNWDRALEHGYAVVNKEVRDRYGTPDYEDDEDEDEEEDDDEVEVDDDVEASEGEEVETVAVGDDEDEEEDTEEADAASEGETDAVASKEGNSSGKSKKKVRKVEADVSTQEILAESKDDTEPDSPDSSTPQAKLDDTIE